MRNGVVAALLAVAIVVGAGAGYVAGYTNERTVTSVSTVVSTSTSVISNIGAAGCSGTPVDFQAIPVNFTHMPVLLMRPNSPAVVCVTYQDGWNGNASQFSYWTDAFDYGYYFFPTSTYKLTCTSTPQYSGCSSYDSHSVLAAAYPDPIQPQASVAEVTVVYSVYALPNATGFYDRTFIYGCETPRLAVGYSAQQVNSSDFATIFEHSCPNLPYVPISIAVSGMNVTYVRINTTGP